MLTIEGQFLEAYLKITDYLETQLAGQTFTRCLIIPTCFGYPFILCDTSLQEHAKKQSKHILESYM